MSEDTTREQDIEALKKVLREALRLVEAMTVTLEAMVADVRGLRTELGRSTTSAGRPSARSAFRS